MTIIDRFISFLCLLALSHTCFILHAATIDERIKIDQFGYLPNAQKIAVISNPQTGYNAPSNIVPTSTYRVKRASDHITVFSAPLTVWNSGNTHDQSGDKVWWFDFSSLITPGNYYVYDSINDSRSFEFEIAHCVYKNVMKQALRTFYYQRCGTAKALPHAETAWADGTCHRGNLQDLDCRLYNNNNASTSKDLHGGWHDAGDYNKYVNFTFAPLIDLLLAYEHNPQVFTDDFGLPESGNGVSDLLDEVKWELDWLLRMQQANGSVLSVVGVQNFASASPPSADNAQRFYGPATTSASFSAAAVFALGAIQFAAAGQTIYANTLEAAATNAYNWAMANPNITFYNSGTIASGENELSDYTYSVGQRRLAAAIFLFARTANTTYRTYIDANYTNAHLLQWTFAYPFEATHQDALLYYAKTTSASTSVKNAIQNAYSNSMANSTENLPAFTTNTDAYRAYLKTEDYTWGSNTTKCHKGNMYRNMLKYNLDAPNADNYTRAAVGFLHYIHGINPTAFVYLSNMEAHGAEKSVPEFYHSWFANGSALWDRADVSTYGPAPGFVPGGANPNFAPDGACSCYISPPQGQPTQKSFKDWNTSWPENSWEITENSIYTNASYVRLIANYVCCTTAPPNVTGNQTVCPASLQTYSVAPVIGGQYTWTVTGGSIQSGQGTNTINVLWNNGVSGSVSVSVIQ